MCGVQVVNVSATLGSVYHQAPKTLTINGRLPNGDRCATMICSHLALASDQPMKEYDIETFIYVYHVKWNLYALLNA